MMKKKRRKKKKEEHVIVKEDQLHAERKEMVNDPINKGQKDSDVVDMVKLVFK